MKQLKTQPKIENIPKGEETVKNIVDNYIDSYNEDLVEIQKIYTDL